MLHHAVWVPAFAGTTLRLFSDYPMDARDVIKIGMSAERTLVVPPERTVGHFVPHMPMVYATPMMILEMEMTSGDAINGHLEPGWVTVGTEVDIRHLAATPGRRHGADHGAGDRGGAPGDPLRGRGLRRRAPHRRGPPRPRPRQCRDVSTSGSGRASEAGAHDIVGCQRRVLAPCTRLVTALSHWWARGACHRTRIARRLAVPSLRYLTTSPVPSSAASPRRPRGSAATACRRVPSALPAPRRWCRRAR